MKTRMLCVVMMVFFALSAYSLAEAMTAEKVIENTITSYEKQMKGVEDFTVIEEGDAAFPAFTASRIATYRKRAVINGRTVYKIRNETEGLDKKVITVWDGVYLWWIDPVSRKAKKEKMDINPFQILENLKAAQANYAGTEKIDGHKTHILDVKDLNKMMGAGRMQKVSGKLWVDTGDYVIRKIEMNMEVKDEKGEKRTVRITVRKEDFRRVNGMFMPYRTVMTVPVPGTPKISPEKEQEMRKNLAEMQRQIEQAPPVMKKMIEAMIKPQIEMMEKMLAGGGIETITVVKEVKVNTGLSDELFDGSRLKRR